MPFEGAEKKFELLLSNDHQSLRNLSAGFWERVVRAAGADIIARTSSPSCDAYLLSESSLFVSDRRAVMITCGTTNLVAGVEALLDGIPDSRVQSLIYERKNENFPDLQPSRFEEDVDALSRILPGTALRFGDPLGHHLSLFHLNREFVPDDGDITIELLMYGLDPDIRESFSRTPEASEDRTLLLAGMDGILPGFETDDYFFDPVGYSLNGVRDDYYYTVHVTPEEPGSYTSIETNYPLHGQAIQDLISGIVSLFMPHRFDVVLFQKQVRLDEMSTTYALGHEETRVLGCGYQVQFSHFEQRESHRRVDHHEPAAALISREPGTA
jgi:S-adenosylmethionine decarboxylase